MYCLEAPDVPQDVVIDDCRIRISDAITARPVHRVDLLDGVTTLTTPMQVLDHPVTEPYPAVVGSANRGAWSRPTTKAQLVPYYAWANRTLGPMRIWLPMDGGGG